MYRNAENIVDFQALRVRASRHTIPWPKAWIRRAGVNSFGYGGTNCHIIVEEATQLLKNKRVRLHTNSIVSSLTDMFGGDENGQETSLDCGRRPYLLVISAKDEVSLADNKRNFLQHLTKPNVRLRLDDLAYTLSARRTNHSYRAYALITGFSLNQAEFVNGKTFLERPRIGFVFTGQGSQWPQMGRELIQTFPDAARCLKRLDVVLQGLLSPPKWTLVGALLANE